MPSSHSKQVLYLRINQRQKRQARGILDQLLKDPQRVADMGAMAANWAREVFAPDRYALRAIDALLQNRNYANLCGVSADT